MKRILLLSFQLLLFVNISHATVWTVSNLPGNTAQYTTITAAVGATTTIAGDTIYVQGSETTYGDFKLNKKLVFIGPGHNPQKQFALKAQINTITMGEFSGATGSSFIGLKIYSIDASSNFTITDITIKRCSVSYITAAVGSTANSAEVTGWVIEGNIIIGISVGSTTTTPNNFFINNNIITGYIYYASGCFISNNVFIAGISNTSNAFYYVTGCTLQNNIFYGIKPGGAESSTFNNNLNYNTVPDAAPYGTNIGNGNKLNVDPSFTTFDEAGSTTFKYEYDFHLKTGSPGEKAGTDGTDIGLYGGVGFSETGEPAVPQIREFIIKNGVVAPNSKLNITIKAEAKN